MSEDSDAYLRNLKDVFIEVTMVIETTQHNLEIVTNERDQALERIEELERLLEQCREDL